MLAYLALVGIVVGVNILPAFGPPTWTIMVFFRLQSHIPAVPLVVLGVLSAATGRVILAYLAGRLERFLPERRKQSLGAAKQFVTSSKARSISGMALFLISPIPSAQLFVVVGLTRMRLAPVVAVFMLGRLITFSLYVTGATLVRESFGDALTSSFTSPVGIGVQILMLVLVVVIVQIDWVKVLRRFGYGDPEEHPGATA